MHLKRLELNGFKSFAKKSTFIFDVPIIAIVGPNGSGKSNVVEAIRFVLGEQSVKSMRGKTGSDLIFKGSRVIPKMSRASVSIVFDNHDRVFSLPHSNNSNLSVDFDELVISREVFSDGGNKYAINGTEVRMKDIHELIASINIGASGHHIISQGEADRYLNANVRDRRELIEEALGLKVYQYRIKEAKRKLERAEANIRETELLRREIAPHLRFLKRQVDKIEKAKLLREELSQKYREYFSRENYLIEKLHKKLKEEQSDILQKIREVEVFLREHMRGEEKHFAEEDDIKEKKQELQLLSEKKSQLSRELGKLEGMIDLLEKQKNQNREQRRKTFSYEEVKNFLNHLLTHINSLEMHNFENIMSSLKSKITHFLDSEKKAESVAENDDIQLLELKTKRQKLFEELQKLTDFFVQKEKEIISLEQELQTKKEAEQEQQKYYYEKLALQKELVGKREILETQEQALGKRIFDRDEELQEARSFLGELPSFQELLLEDDAEVNALNQEGLRREIERIKIRLEDMGGGSGADVIKEYEETRERDAFLQREIEDIQQSISSLKELMRDLKDTLNSRFQIGVEKINVQFDRFFKLMFGGGSARLERALIVKRKRKISEGEQLDLLEEEKIEKEYGLDIKVKLPRKKVSDLDMLSGGERSLTSIALLFALSQVNPPPFLVLDETDAALDEANSQKYGDMIEALSKFSQLIVVTHNRETMSRAQTLFGVTLGRDDASTMLSLRLEDATKYAK